MRRLPGVLFLLGSLVLLAPMPAQAQTLAGLVRDTSGAVLPGVTVEAASPVLIEKVRSTVTDGTGQYRLTDLAPGTYAVTYTLPGFAKVVRDGVVLTGSGVTTINADMRVGTLEETITVTGETPIVDVQSTRRETVLNSEALSTLPATRTYGAFLTAVPGLMTGTGNMSAMTTPDMTFFTAHGGRANEGRVTLDGLNVAASFNGGGVSTFTYDVANAEEMQVLVSGGLGEAENGGPQINLIPRSGGNAFRGSAFYSNAGDWSSSDNIDDRLRGLGIVRAPALIKSWDASATFGGPLKRDKLWFFFNARNYGSATPIEGIFGNKNAGDAARWDYVRDDGLEARNLQGREIYSVRLTSQITSRNRVSFSHEYQHRCSGSTATLNGEGCRSRESGWSGLGAAGGTPSSPEAWPGYHDFPYYVTQATWSSPVTNKLLLDGGFSRFHYLWAGFGIAPPDAIMNLIPVTEQSNVYGRPNFSYRAIYDPLGGGAFADNDANPNNWKASAAYVTGAHNLKVGYQGSYQRSLQGRVPGDTQLRYLFNSTAPATASCTISPSGTRLCPIGVSYYIAHRWEQNDRTASHSLYLQDQWTMGRMTFQGALRYDRASSWAPAEGNGATTTSRFNPQPITFDRTVSVRGYSDITPRMGFAYDVFGTGKTSLKVNLGKYLQSATNDENYWANNPARRIVTSLTGTRGWDDANRNFVVDCDLSNPAAQNNAATGGDTCAGLTGNNLNFGSPNPGSTIVNPDILGGWGVRPWDWSFGASVQHEVLPRVSVEVGYYRRWFGNFFVTDNTATTATDYDRWTLTAPQHPNLPGAGSTYTYYTPTVAAAGRAATNYQTFETDYGAARTQYWHGVDFTANARLARGLTLQGGTSTGRGVRDNCEAVAKLPELLVVIGTNQRLESCHVTEKWITSFRGLAAYTIPKVDVLVSATMRSLKSNALGMGGDSATNGTSISANIPVPNAVVQQSLGRLPAGQLPTGSTTVNMLTPGVLYGPERVNQVDMRFAKILRFGRSRADIGIDLYNIFNTNDPTTYQQTFDYATNGAAWLTPTAIVNPRFARFNVTVSF